MRRTVARCPVESGAVGRGVQIPQHNRRLAFRMIFLLHFIWQIRVTEDCVRKWEAGVRRGYLEGIPLWLVVRPGWRPPRPTRSGQHASQHEPDYGKPAAGESDLDKKDQPILPRSCCCAASSLSRTKLRYRGCRTPASHLRTQSSVTPRA